MSNINKIFALALILFLTGCSIGGEKKIKIFSVEKPREKLDYPMPTPLQMEEIKWIIITSKNADEVFKKLEEKFPELWCKNDHQNRDFDDYHAAFDCMIDPESKRYLSEDYAFCRRWQQAGGKIFADVNTTLGHVGNLPFSGCMDERLKA